MVFASKLHCCSQDLFGSNILFLFRVHEGTKRKDVIRIVKENKALIAKYSIDRFGRIQRGMTDVELLAAAKNIEQSGRYDEAATA